MQYGNTKEKNNQKIKKDMFKSYYVVWKLTNIEKVEAIPSLNRTMQYGNAFPGIDKSL